MPILVYCGDLRWAQYVHKHKGCSATNLGSGCQAFINELAPEHALALQQDEQYE